MSKRNDLTLQQIREIRAYYQEYRNHEQSMSKFGLTPSQEYAINKLGNEFILSDQEIYIGLKELDINDCIPESVASVVLDDKQFATFLERRDRWV